MPTYDELINAIDQTLVEIKAVMKDVDLVNCHNDAQYNNLYY